MWDFTYKTEKGNATARWVNLPFTRLVHNTKFATTTTTTTTDISPIFKPEAIIEVAINIGGKDDQAGKVVYYFDEITGSKRQN